MLIIQNLKKSFGNRAIIRNFSYVFPEKTIIALVGVNGAGKTTLIKILTNQENYEEGKIIQQKDKIVGYLPQEYNPTPEDTILQECCAGNEHIFGLNKRLQEIEEKLAYDYTQELVDEFEEAERIYRNANGYSFENSAKNVLLGLGFKEGILNDHPQTLSGGWRMRLEIARLLVKKPDLLILDEPTNHLDLPSIEWLEEYLKKFEGTVLFVSHDESLLNSLPDRILHIEAGQIKEYIGNYDDFLEQKAHFEEIREQKVKTLEKKAKQLSKFVDRFKAKASLATQAKNKEKMVARLNEEISQLGNTVIAPEVNIKIPIITQSGKEVLFFNGEIGYNNIPLAKKFDFVLRRGEKIGLIGANGLGKSTFIKTIIGEIPLVSGSYSFGHNVQIGYYAQEQTKSLDEEKSVLENMKELNSSFPEAKLMKILGSFLFKKDDIHKPVRILSGGEKSRLSLAILLIRDINFLILDEPTNHLDIISVQILANALESFEGTVLFVSHNRTFIDIVATHLLMFEPGQMKLMFT